jgi:hypothetical protein
MLAQRNHRGCPARAAQNFYRGILRKLLEIPKPSLNRTTEREREGSEKPLRLEIAQWLFQAG